MGDKTCLEKRWTKPCYCSSQQAFLENKLPTDISVCIQFLMISPVCNTPNKLNCNDVSKAADDISVCRSFFYASNNNFPVELKWEVYLLAEDNICTQLDFYYYGTLTHFHGE